jgi:AcrR family transcriptional regulator
MSHQKRKRRYTSPARDAAAAETRRRIRSAAAELFVSHGYAGTSMKSVATHAGVSERTVFLAFPTKAALLSACIRVAVRGDAEAIPMLARDRWVAALEARPQRIFGLLADAVTDLYGRAAPLLAVGESAAPHDPLLEEERQRGHAATRSDSLEVAQAMKRAGALRRGISPKQAADVMYAVAADESIYLRLVEECGWSPAAYSRMLERALAGALGR